MLKKSYRPLNQGSDVMCEPINIGDIKTKISYHFSEKNAKNNAKSPGNESVMTAIMVSSYEWICFANESFPMKNLSLRLQ